MKQVELRKQLAKARAGLYRFLGGLYAPEGHHIPQHQSAGFQHLLIRGFPRLGAEVQGQLGGQGVL